MYQRWPEMRDEIDIRLIRSRVTGIAYLDRPPSEFVRTDHAKRGEEKRKLFRVLSSEMETYPRFRE